MKSSIVRLVGLLVLATPGLLLLALALSADFGPLESPGSRFGAAQWLLLAMSVFSLIYGLFVHAKAVTDRKKAGRPYVTTVLFLTVPTVVVTLLAVSLAELVAGLLPAGRAPGLIFPPHSSASFQTAEFTCTVQTNSLGIRDREISPDPKSGSRILAIGDSFTNGWGVDGEQSWPKVLQCRLREAGRDIEVLNLGGAGASPKDYALLARRAIPELKPDLVLVAVLQGDDLAQLHYREGKPRRSAIQNLLESVLPNLSRRLAQLQGIQPLEITADEMRRTWQRQTRSIQERGLTAEEKLRLENLDEHVRQMYAGGDLNPAQLRVALEHPDYFSFTLAIDNTEVQAAIDTMAAHLLTIKQDAAKVDAHVLVISVPSGPYVSRRSLGNFRRLGFRLSEAMLEDDAPDRAIRSACERAGLEFHSVTDHFRKACTQRTLYYEFDGHFNPQGQALFAAAVCEHLLAHGVGKMPLQ